jgi:uncharacterized protein YraI
LQLPEALMRLLVALCLFLSLTSAPGLAADIARQPFDNGTGALISVSGPFEAGDDKALARALLETQGTAVVLFKSPGGSLLAGLAMGRAIRLQGATTVVDDGATCASACGLAWLGGVRRMMGAGAKVGFHAAYYVDDQGRSIETGQGNALIGAYLNQLGLSEKAVLYITQAAPADMTWLTFDDADDLGISVRQVGAAAPARPATAPPRPAAAPAPGPTAPPVRQAAPKPAAPPPAAPPAPAGAAGWQIVHHAPAGYMNIRSGPGTQHPVIFTLAPAQPVSLGTCRTADPGGGTGQWCLVSATGKQGWISRIGLEPAGTTAVPERLSGNWQIVQDAPAGYMNVRRGAGTGHEVLFTVAPGVPVGVSRCRVGDAGNAAGIWCEIVTGGRSGWISRSGLEPEGSAPRAASAPAAAPSGWRVKPGISGGSANVRTGPGTMHAVAFAVPAGTSGLRVERCQPSDPGGGRFDWCLIIWQGRSGWVSQNGIEPGG